MKTPGCGICLFEDTPGSRVKRAGKYYRRCTDSRVQIYECLRCGKRFSDATFEPEYRQKKLAVNALLYAVLTKLMSQRGAAELFKLNRKTVVRKFRHGSLCSRGALGNSNLAKAKATKVVFDDLETHENSIYKPLSITMAVEFKTRRILAVEVSQMPYRGALAKKAREKYGPRKDERRAGRRRLFEKLRDLVEEGAEFLSDANPDYVPLVKEYFPHARHRRFLSRRARAHGQGELKIGGFDPLFWINQTCGMLRANVNRLIRKTWCTTKLPERLEAHLILYAHAHNVRLEERERKKAARLQRRAANLATIKGAG